MSHRLILLAAVMVFTGCARKLPPYEKPIARSQFQRVRTTAYTHTESDHLQHGSQTCIGTTLRHDAVHSAAAKAGAACVKCPLSIAASRSFAQASVASAAG